MAQVHYSHTGLSWDREGRSSLLGDEQLKSLSFPVSNLQSRWKGPLGNILTRCCLRGPEAEAPPGLAGAQGRLLGWLVPALTAASLSSPGRPARPHAWLAARETQHSQHSLPMAAEPPAPSQGPWQGCQGSACPQGGNTTPLGTAAPWLCPATPLQLMLVASSHYLVNLLVSLLADNFFQDFPVPLNEPARQTQAQEP